MARAIVILALACLGTGCASGGFPAEERQALISEISNDEPGGPTSTTPIAPQEETAAAKANARDPSAGQSGKPGAGGPGGVDAQERKEPAWERADQETEQAIIEDHLRRTEKHRWHQRARRWGANAYVQIGYPANRSALDGYPIEDPNWDDLLKNGWGAGLDLSWQPVPAFEPFIGVQYSRNTGTSTLITDQTQFFNLESSELQALPFYGGVRFNFPLNESLSDWFSTSAGGMTTGVVPYIRVAGGGAWIFGNEIEITDLSAPPATKLDFIGRGFTGYVEGAVGIEYRTEKGYAFRLSVAVQAYPGIRLDREFEAAYPGVDLQRLEVAILPRISATYYF